MLYKRGLINSSAEYIIKILNREKVYSSYDIVTLNLPQL